MQIDELIEANQRVARSVWETDVTRKGKDMVIEYLFRMICKGYWYNELSETFVHNGEAIVPPPAPAFDRTEPIQGETRTWARTGTVGLDAPEPEPRNRAMYTGLEGGPIAVETTDTAMEAPEPDGEEQADAPEPEPAGVPDMTEEQAQAVRHQREHQAAMELTEADLEHLRHHPIAFFDQTTADNNVNVHINQNGEMERETGEGETTEDNDVRGQVDENDGTNVL